MKKSVIRVSCLMLAATMALPLVGCKKEQKNDTETRPVVFATDAADGKFNPFFATSATDSEMVGMTQLGMLTTDDKGAPIAGENEPTVALSYNVDDKSEPGYTNYEFVIKNGIKFSDGSDLTIKDVLFNLYVYLDPSYMGSATMYSTDIVGLADYRAQEVDTSITDNELNTKFDAEAYTRTQDIIYHLDGKTDTVPTRSEDQINADIETLKGLFKEEVERDWTANQGGLEGYKDEYTFDQDWQVYYFNEGIISVVYNSTTGKPLREKSTTFEADGVTLKPGKYVTTITPAGVTLDDDSTYDGASYRAEIVDGVKAAQADTAKIQAYVDGGASEADALNFVTRDYVTNYVYDAKTQYTGDLLEILSYWASGANLMDKFVAEARTKYFEDLKNKNDGELIVSNISGITTTKKEVNGKTHDVLNIKIKGVDPKAIYNFAFSVAPMEYYSGSLDGVDYIKLAREDTTNKHFGVAFNNNKFFETVLQADHKNAKPVGAGAYQVSNQKGEVGESVKGSDFYSNNWMYFARNNYFTSVGDKIENAKIKYVRYKVVNSENIIESLRTGEIDVGEPNATQDNMDLIKDIKNVNQKTVETNGYGYVGINPKFVPDIEVRRAIMSVMDTIHCLDYYSDKYADLIYRSMSKSSWVWDTEEMPTEAYYPVTLNKAKIQEMVAYAGWLPTGAGGKLMKDGKTLKLTFTIAGATTDHPAYTMFTEAAKVLNEYGFDITVTKDIGALQKLATGGLEVWAAAWSSTVDPDMYQVYHRDSNASSIKNWGYETIFNTSGSQFEDGDNGVARGEKTIINELSNLIDQGRQYNDQATRSKIYAQALDLVMELAVEMPTYQRNDCVAYNKNVISEKSLNKKPTAFAGVIDKIWELDYV